jgi:hypothetical protein
MGRLVASLYNLDDSFQIFLGELGARGQTQSSLEKISTYRPSANATAFKNWLKMHGFPDGTGFDILSLQSQTNRLPIGTELFRGNQGNSKPTVGLPVGCLRHKFNPWKVSQSSSIVLIDESFLSDFFVETFELTSPHGSEEIT